MAGGVSSSNPGPHGPAPPTRVVEDDMTFMRAALTAAMCALGALPAFGQAPAVETRHDLIAREQAEKARAAAPYEPGRAEALFQRFEERGFPFVGTPPGFYPALGSVYPGGRF